MTRPIQPLSLSEKAFAKTFIRDFSSPYAIQQPDGRRANWRTKYNKVSDPLINAHLRGDYWLGTKAAWYPVFFNLDVDHPTPKVLDTIFERFDNFGINENQYLCMTSPSYDKSGNFRIYLKLEYSDRTPTHKLGFDSLKNNFGDVCEIYPQKRRKDRLPCGRSQDLIADGKVLSGLSWQEEMHYLLKIDPTPIEKLPREPLLFDLDSPIEEGDKAASWKPRKEIVELITHGLQAHSTRHFSQYEILNYRWRCNWLPNDAATFTKRWVKTKTNGFSKDAAAARWSSINAEIDRQTAWIWARSRILMPDTPHGLNAAITKSDLEFTAELFKADAVRQKQFLNLISYVRPRQHHEWVFIPAWVWFDNVASKDTYKKFIAELEERGLLESNHSYRVGEYSKRFKLKLPQTNEQPLAIDGRNTTDFYDALWHAYGSVRDIADLTGFNRMTLHRQFKQG
jgi:hypothetical protein